MPTEFRRTEHEAHDFQHQTDFFGGGLPWSSLPLVALVFFTITRFTTALKSFSGEQVSSQAASVAPLIQLFLQEEVKLTVGIANGNTTIDVSSKVAEEGIQNAAQDIGRLDRKLKQAMRHPLPLQRR